MKDGIIKHKGCNAYVVLYWHKGAIIFVCTECSTNWSVQMGITVNMPEDLEVSE